MKNYYTERDIAAVLGQDLPASEAVENRIRDTYEYIRKTSRVPRRPDMRMWKTAVVAAALTVALSLAAFASAKHFGLTDFLTWAGMTEPEAVTELATSEGGQTFSNNYANYKVCEALSDGEVLYVVFEVTPKDEQHFLTPQYLDNDDKVIELGIDGVTEGTIGEYASSLGKETFHADVALYNGENLLDGTTAFYSTPDGSIYYCLSTANTFETDDITLRCAGIAYTADMPVADRVEFEYKLFNKSSGTRTHYDLADHTLAEETGIALESLTVTETELGLYAEFTWRGNTPDGTVLSLGNGAGQSFEHMPYYTGTGTLDNGDGTYTRTVAYQKPAGADTFTIVLHDRNDSIAYGPYELTES